jgi:hypothetical protein
MARHPKTILHWLQAGYLITSRTVEAAVWYIWSQGWWCLSKGSPSKPGNHAFIFTTPSHDFILYTLIVSSILHPTPST